MIFNKAIYCQVCLLSLVVVFAFLQRADAQDGMYRAPEMIFPRNGLEQRIGFWKDIFAKYGKDQLVFHYRDYPWLVYTVLDLSAFTERYSGTELKQARDRAVAYEERRISDALTALANGSVAENDLERHIAEMFSGLAGGRNKYLLALGEGQIRNQSGIRELFIDGVRRSGRYLYAIESIFAREGLPIELSRIPLVESSFNYNAYSSVGAAGIWQFMRVTGKKYLIISSGIDERRDPLASTRAAAQYLKHSFDVLGSWPAAITSYNHGLNGMVRAVKETGSSDMSAIIKRYIGDSFGFASQNFYCEFLAALEVEKNYRFYFPGLVKEGPWYVDEIKIERAHRLPELLSMTGLNKDEFLSYNLALLDPIAKGKTSVPGGFTIKVPRGSGSGFMGRSRSERERRKTPAEEVDKIGTMITELEQEESRFKDYTDLYKVSKGETIFSIARKFSVSGNQLMAANNLTSPRALRAGRAIKVPDRTKTTARAKFNPNDTERERAKVEQEKNNLTDKKVEEREKGKEYLVQKGDTLSSIARKQGIPQNRLKEINNLKESKIKVGQFLRIE